MLRHTPAALRLGSMERALGFDAWWGRKPSVTNLLAEARNFLHWALECNYFVVSDGPHPFRTFRFRIFFY